MADISLALKLKELKDCPYQGMENFRKLISLISRTEGPQIYETQQKMLRGKCIDK